MAAYTAIDDPSAYFKVQLYTGNGSTQSITFDDTDTDLQPDMLWIKCRTGAENHTIVDSVRGDSTENTGYKYLQSNTTSQEQAHSGNTLVDAITSDGFNIGNNDQVNTSSQPYVAWAWKETADAGFDIIQFTGNSTARTISHSLSAVPKVILMKNLANADAQWVVYHVGTGNTQALYLNTTATPTDVLGFFNDTDPTSSVFTVGTDTAVNGNTNSQINYAWSEKQGYSKFGSFTGNGNADGPFVFCGFKPAFVLTKNASSTSEWHIYDNKRDTINPNSNVLSPNANYADSISANCDTDFLSNGFKLRNSNSNRNENGSTHIFMAFAEAPFVNSKGVPCNAR